jgi:hypothetical protein
MNGELTLATAAAGEEAPPNGYLLQASNMDSGAPRVVLSGALSLPLPILLRVPHFPGATLRCADCGFNSAPPTSTGPGLPARQARSTIGMSKPRRRRRVSGILAGGVMIGAYCVLVSWCQPTLEINHVAPADSVRVVSETRACPDEPPLGDDASVLAGGAPALSSGRRADPALAQAVCLAPYIIPLPQEPGGTP